MKEYLETQEIADLLGVNPRTIQRYLTSGKIQGGVKIGRIWRIPKDSFQKFIQEQGTLNQRKEE